MSPRPDCRQAVLDQIGRGLGRVGERPSQAEADAEWERLARGFTRSSASSLEDTLSLFIERLRDYDATVQQLAPAAVLEAIGSALAQRDPENMIAAHGFARVWPECAGLHLPEDDGLSPVALDRFAGVLTTATLGIAETGTLVLQNVPGQGRRATSLIPDFHLCVLRAADVVATVPEAFDRLSATSHLPTTFVSGPSATADIEMTRIKGVHGPRFLHVLLVGA